MIAELLMDMSAVIIDKHKPSLGDSMRRNGRTLQVGDKAVTDFNGKGLTTVVITDRNDNASSQSGVSFRVDPPLKGGDGWTWYDSDWFECAIDAKASISTVIAERFSFSELCELLPAGVSWGWSYDKIRPY